MLIDSNSEFRVTNSADEDRLFAAVSDLIVQIAETCIVPRHRALAAAEVMFKSRNEVVTAVDGEVEERLIAALTALDPDARMVGEESVEAGTATLEDLGTGRLWLIDPLDGTANFASGEGPFGVMVALVVSGSTRAAWLYEPLRRTLSTAVAGRGSFVNGERVAVRGPAGRPVAAIAGQFMPADLRERLAATASADMDLRPIPRCAAAHYPMLVSGEHDVAIFQRTLPWDHAAGALFLTEAGGSVSRWDGGPFTPAAPGVGIVATTSPALHEQTLQRFGSLLCEVGGAGLA
jgi:fructose-1,6-bisphosphatase/inositol monophosphatase family enzyme